MKKLLVLLTVVWMVCACGEDYDDSVLTNRVESLEGRVAQLEELCKQMNTNISSLQTLVKAVENKDYVTGVTPIVKEDKEVGYTITFTQSKPVTIYHGKDGKNGTDGKDGTTPVVGVEKAADGMYYWTLNGDWLLDKGGSKVKAVGTDGKDGTNGADGTDGKDGMDGEDGKDGADGKDGVDGKDGITPQLKIENNSWYVSYDNGANWTRLGAAVVEGTPGGNTPAASDGMFQSVTVDEHQVVFTLKDGTSFTLPRYQAVSISFDADEQGITAGTTLRIPYTLANATADTKVSVSSDGNYKARLEEQTLSGGIITVTAPSRYTDGYINVLVSNGSYTSLNVISFYEMEMTITGQETETQPVYSVTTDGGDVNIPLAVNFDYTVNIPAEAAGWVEMTVESRAVMRYENLILKVKPNTTLTARSCIIRLIPKNGLEAFIEIIIQQASALFSIDRSHFIAEAAGETFTATIHSSAGLKVNVPSQDTWVTTSVASTGNDYTLTLNVVENISTSRRSSIVELYSEDGNTLLAKLDVAQLAVNEDELKDLVFVVSANVINDFTVYLPITYECDIDCIIDWGDGQKEHFAYDISQQKTAIFHKYEGINSATEFEVRVSGKVPWFASFAMPEASKSTTIFAIKQWGDVGLRDMKAAFSGVISLKSIPIDDLGAFAEVSSFSQAFQGCRNLEAIPEGLFSKCTRADIFNGTFMGCSSLKSIPEGLFSNCTNVTSFIDTFSECRNLTSIPENLFKSNTKVTSFDGVFSECTSLATIPENLFMYNNDVTNFNYVFSECTSLSAIPENLFKDCTEVIDFEKAFYECKNLTSIPENLFASCTHIENVDYSFHGCRNLTSIPIRLFDNNRRIISMNGTFGGCSSLTGKSPYTVINGEKVHLYERYKYPTEFVTIKEYRYCFSADANLSDYDNIPNDWK